jgi:drug/metabolite transporter (DMT)-like permease
LTDTIGCILALAAAVNGAVSICYTRQVANELHNSVVGFYYTLTSLLGSPVWTFLVQRKSFPEYTWGLFGILIATGFLYFLMQSLLTYSMKWVTAAMSGVLIYVAIPFSYFLDFVFYGKKLGVEESIGVSLIVVTNVIIGYLKGKGIIK